MANLVMPGDIVVVNFHHTRYLKGEKDVPLYKILAVDGDTCTYYVYGETGKEPYLMDVPEPHIVSRDVFIRVSTRSIEDIYNASASQ